MPATDIGAVFAALTSYQRAAAMKAATDLDMFTAIGEAPRRCSISRPVANGSSDLAAANGSTSANVP